MSSLDLTMLEVEPRHGVALGEHLSPDDGVMWDIVPVR